MESTGVYWWPVYHALAQAGIEVCVCNAAHMRNVPDPGGLFGFYAARPSSRRARWLVRRRSSGVPVQ
jgi:hypothetical protein